MGGETGKTETTAAAEPSRHDRDQVIVPLYVEEAVVTRRAVARGRVRVQTVTRTKEHLIDEELARERVEIERIPVGRYVDAVPPTREENGVTIVPVVEEVLVVERRLLLREEVHMRRVRTTERHRETVRLREQEAVVTREPAPETCSAAAADHQMPTKETL